MRHRPPADPATESALAGAFVALAAGVALHVDVLPLWCSLTAAGALGWRIAAGRGRCGLPPSWLRSLVTVALVLLTAGLFRQLGGLGAGTGLLTTMGALKLLETRSVRDGRILVATTIFLVVAACLDRNGLPRLPLYATTTWLACAALLALGSASTSGRFRRSLIDAGRSLAFALPFAIACFLFFPRLGAPLWSAPGSGQALTGLSDEMSPGSITELVTSDDIAFRVRFDADPPPARQRYWRGPVLHDFDGFTWRRSSTPATPLAAGRDPDAEIRYEITLEASGRNWWFALDRPAAIEVPSGQRALLAADGQILSLRPVSQALTYRAASVTGAGPAASLSSFARRQDLQLPPGRNPRSIELAQGLRARHADATAFAQAVLDDFRARRLRYSLSPPPLQQDSVDDLLFRTREGFCGHFASAFGTLLRAGGVPARVVTGYLGGELNDYGGYYTVRQSEAHAWTEAWIEGRGWIRFDPTAVVEPGRLDNSLYGLLPGLPTSALRSSEWSRQLLDYWDAGNQWWQRRIVGYNPQTQRALLERLGLPDADYRVLVGLLAAGAGLWLALLAWRLRRTPTKARPDPVAAAWDSLRQTLADGGVSGLETAGPRTLVARAGSHWPELAAELARLAADYEQLRFQPPSAADKAAASREFQRRLRRLLPRLRKQRPPADPGRAAAASRRR